MEEDDVSVRVAVRIRPQIPREIIDMYRICTQVTPGEPQIVLGTDKAFTYDYVFDTDTMQDTVYEICVSSLINGALDGYNATVLAYGQTGSGKTYTMGTGFDVDILKKQQGIIPRAVLQLFQNIDHRINQAYQSGCIAPKFKITAQFLELYNEELIDLFNPIKSTNIRGKGYKINEDPDGGIHIKGVTLLPVHSFEDAMQYLQTGALSRTTASTQMNAQSSRSHAIFTLFIKQERLVPVIATALDDMDTDSGADTNPSNEFETLTAKFHFVDLAGSERLKRTGATGERAKEGIAINCGLLALGNVISALGDKTKKALHVPYRDSKLTRLLQDSLGGNSQTVMIACISPSDRDFMETLNTLKYANRARNIKNRVTINQDKSSQKINILKQQIAQLQLELLEYKQGKRIVDADGTETINDMFYENNMLQSELNNLKTRVKAMQETIEALNVKNSNLLLEKESSGWMNVSPNIEVTTIVQAYLQEIEDLRAKLLETNYMSEQLRKIVKAQEHLNKSITSAGSPSHLSRDPSLVIQEAKQEVIREKELLERSKIDSEEINYDSSDKDSDSELDSDNEDKVNSKLQAELVNLTTDIDMKEKLINELELSQQRLQVMRQHYEEKLIQLNIKIRDTQVERDKVLQSFVGQQTEPTEKIQRVRHDYEKRIQDMQKELKRLQAAQKEHVRLLRNQTQHETQLRTLKTELTDMKRVKVKLLNKMKEEAQKHRDAETKRVREIAQLRKESRKNANMIRSMEAERRIKEQVLRRKQEEVSALKKEKKTRLSLKVAGRVGGLSKYSPKVTKQKWASIENMVNKFSFAKQSLVEQELRMELLLEKRENLGKDLEKYQLKRATLLRNQQPTVEVDNFIEDLGANINYIQETISETQHNVMEIEESQDVNEVTDVAQSVSDLNEARYLLQKLINMTINQSYAVAQRDAKLKESEASLNEMKQEVHLRSQLLDHMLHTDQEGLRRSAMVASYSSNANESEVEFSSTATSRSSSPVDNENKIKIRKRTALPQELLFGKPTESISQDNDQITKFVPSSSETTLRGISFVRAYSTIDKPERDSERKTAYPTSPRASPRIALHHSTKHGSLEEGLNRSPLNSPLASNKHFGRDDNVFSRLTASTLQTDVQSITGHITPYDGKNQANRAMHCVFVAMGHNSGVLSMCATDDLLFTGAADRTVKVWDLHKGVEKQTLAAHPNNVVAVRYLPTYRMLLSASLAFVKVWDLRTPGFQCMKILCSSGMTQSGSSLSPLSSNRRVQMPVGESQINDVIFNSAGTMICTASSGKAKLWDLRKLAPVAKLNSGHQAAIMCLACERLNASNDMIITGSKDHYIKAFNISSGTTGNILPSLNLEPPHYDGIQSLAVGRNILFSGSRDMCIKKWDLNRATLVQSISNAHKNWICGLALIRDNKLLLSGCRNGFVKLWDARTCDQLAEMKAHNSAINAITTNTKHIFTSSNSGEVKIWTFHND